MTTKAICVWLDSIGGDEPKWIVSLDSLDADGGAETSQALHVEEEEDAALDLGREEAGKRGLPLYRNSHDGPAVLVEAAANV